MLQRVGVVFPKMEICLIRVTLPYTVIKIELSIGHSVINEEKLTRLLKFDNDALYWRSDIQNPSSFERLRDFAYIYEVSDYNT